MCACCTGEWDWRDINGEEFNHAEVAELRKVGYWEKSSFAEWLEFRVTEGAL